mgnify:CR=1 FL=1
MITHKPYSLKPNRIVGVISIALVLLGFMLPSRADPPRELASFEAGLSEPVTVPSTLKVLSNRLAGLQAALAEPNTRQRRAEIEPMQSDILELRDQLLTLEAEVLNEFEDIAAQIRAQNLPAEIWQRHFDAVTRLKQNRETLLNALDGLALATDTQRLRGATDQAVAHLQSITPSKHIPFDPNHLPVRFSTGKVRAPFETQAQWQPLLGQSAPDTLSVRKTSRTKIAPPTDADLAQTPAVQFSDELKNLAKTLEYNPISILRWVYDNIEFIPTYGSIQGATLTYLNKRGNSTDISALLASLLRISKIHSRFVVATVEIPAHKMVNWLGVSDAGAAKNLLAQGGIPTTVVISGGAISSFKIEHVFVAGWIDFNPSSGARHRKGDTWVPMDASFKQYEYHKGLDLSEAVPVPSELAESLAAQIDPNGLGVTGLDAELINTAIEDYDEALAAYVYQHHPDLTLADLLPSKSIIPSKRRYLSMSLPFRVVSKAGYFAQLPDNLRHSLTLKFYNSVSAKQLDNPALNYTISLSALSDLRLGITYEPISETDAQAFSSFRDSDSETLPVYLFRLKPVIKLEDTVVASGSAIGMGQPQYLKMILNDPHQSHPAETVITVGDLLVVGVNAGGTTLSQVQRRIDTVDPYTAAENLHLTALHFWAEHDFFDQISAQYYGVRRVRLPSVGLFASPLSVSYFFGIAREGGYRSREIDIKLNYQAVVAPTAEIRLEFMSDIGIHSSYLESSVLEQLFDYYEGRGLSTTQILADANAQNIPIYTITSENFDQIWPLLRVSASVKTDIQNAIGAGQIVIIPERELQRDGWIGTGYIIRDPITGEGAYRLESGLNGGMIECLLCEFSKYPQIDYTLVLQVITGILLEMYWPSFTPIVGTNLASLGVQLAVKGTTFALRTSVKTVARSLLKKSIKRNGGLPKRGPGKKQQDKKKTCSCPPSQTLRKKGNSPKKDEICLELISISFSAKNPKNYLKIWQDEMGEELTEISPPEWDDGESKPLGYVSGASIRLTAKFRLLDPPKTGGKAQIIATATVKNRDQNKGARMPKFETPYDITLPSEPNGVGNIYRVEIVSTQLTPQFTQFFNPMTINWALRFNKKQTHIERSDNRVYVTLQKSDQEAFSTYLTPLHLATSNPGAKDKPNAAWKTWQLFAKVEDPNTMGSKSGSPKGCQKLGRNTVRLLSSRLWYT